MFMFSKRQSPGSSNMSIERKTKSPQPKTEYPFTINKQQSLQGTNLVEENLRFRFQQPFSADDPTIALQINLTPLPGQKKRFIDIEQFSTILLNYGGTDFPLAVALSIMEMSGYLDENKSPTHDVAYTMPATISSVTNAGGIIGYNVIYKSPNVSPIWDITGLNTLTFKIKIGDVYQPFPSAQEIAVNVKISRVIF